MDREIKPLHSKPIRMSAPKVEDTKPSKIIAVFWWIVFIVPVVFTYFATQSVILPVVLIVIRIVVMFIPSEWIKRIKPDPPEKKQKFKREPVQISERTIEASVKVNTIKDTLQPYREEAISEWRWLMKKLHIYDYENEEKYLETYRKLRGWE